MAGDAPDSRALWSALMAQAQDGDELAYAQLLRDVAPFVRAFGRKRGLAAAECEDLTQDVLLTIHRVRHTYEPYRPFAAWVNAIAQRRMIDLYRRTRRIRDHEQVSPDSLETFAAPEANDAVEVAERAAGLRQAVAALPPRQREALQLVKLNEMSVAEAAARSGQSTTAIKVNVHRAIKALRRLMPPPR